MAPRREKPKRRAPLSRERVLREALALADKTGVENVTMRKLAAKLRVEAMSLYHHVANKEELLDGMVDLVFAEVEVPRGKTWKEAMGERAESLRAALERHPWATPLLDSRKNAGMETLRHHNDVIACLRNAGFSWSLTSHALSLLDSYIYGFVLQAEALPVDAGGNWETLAGEMLAALPVERFPALASFVEAVLLDGSYDARAEFRYGLDLIFDALEERLARGA